MFEIQYWPRKYPHVTTTSVVTDFIKQQRVSTLEFLAMSSASAVKNIRQKLWARCSLPSDKPAALCTISVSILNCHPCFPQARIEQTMCSGTHICGVIGDLERFFSRVRIANAPPSATESGPSAGTFFILEAAVARLRALHMGRSRSANCFVPRKLESYRYSAVLTAVP